MSEPIPTFPGSEHRVEPGDREDIGYKPANNETTEALKKIAKNNLDEQRAAAVRKVKATRLAYRARNAGEPLTPEQEQLLAEVEENTDQ